MIDKKLRCFVAMAFGSDDTDEVYSQFVSRFKDRLTIRRVDRINHNNDIDDQILLELRQADFVLADLTYARPSVYFEAGYAQGRPVPVVYTARRDHIGKKATEDLRRVHFDLQMRNIIAWTAPDADFFERVNKRIALVTAPLLRDRMEAEERLNRRRAFAALSQYRQLDAITDSAVRTLKRNRFRVEMDDGAGEGGAGMRSKGRRRVKLAIRTDGGRIIQASLYVWHSISKQALAELRTFESVFGPRCNINLKRRPPSRIDKFTYILSPRKVSDQVFRDVFPGAGCDGEQVATYEPEIQHLPGNYFWQRGMAIVPFSSDSLHVGHMRFIYKDNRWTVGDARKPERKMASVLHVPVFRRYIIIGGITDPKDIEARLLSSFGPNCDVAAADAKAHRA